MAEGIPEDLQRWTAKRRAALVLSILKGETALNGTSKGKRLRAFPEVESEAVVAKALRALWDYRDAVRGLSTRRTRPHDSKRTAFSELFIQSKALRPQRARTLSRSSRKIRRSKS